MVFSYVSYICSRISKSVLRSSSSSQPRDSFQHQCSEGRICLEDTVIAFHYFQEINLEVMTEVKSGDGVDEPKTDYPLHVRVRSIGSRGEKGRSPNS